jgi:excinuclease UvrABC nuclease subunit
MMTTKKKTKAGTAEKKKKVTKKAADGEEAVKKVKKKRVTKAEREANEEAERLRDKWQELHTLSEGQPAKKYKITDSFESNTSLDHAKLGWGYVLTSQNNRLEVLFEDGIKILVSNYQVG